MSRAKWLVFAGGVLGLVASRQLVLSAVGWGAVPETQYLSDWIGFVWVGSLLVLAAWALTKIGKNHLRYNFFDKMVLVMFGLYTGYVLLRMFWFHAGPDMLGDYLWVAFGVASMPAAIFCLLSWIFGRALDEEPFYHVTYFPPPPPAREPEPPRREPEPRPVHIGVVRPVGRVFLIRRKDRG